MGTRKKTSTSTAAPTENPAQVQSGADAATAEKAALLDALRAQLADSLAVMMAAAHTARDAATHEEMKAENEKDTRAIEAGYLAAGQSARALELRRALSDLGDVRLTPLAVVGPFALVELEEDVRDRAVRSRVFLAPHASGQRVTQGNGEVQLVSPAAPLAQALLGKRAGDIVELQAGGRLRELTVVRVM